MRRVALVACVSMKRDTPAPARDLYVSPWFKKARAIAETHDAWFILSAAHGVTHPDTTLAPYDTSLTTASAGYRRAWAARVNHELNAILRRGDHVTLLAGARYRADLEQRLRRRGVRVTVPMRGLGIGQQLAFMTPPRALGGAQTAPRYTSTRDTKTGDA